MHLTITSFSTGVTGATEIGAEFAVVGTAMVCTAAEVGAVGIGLTTFLLRLTVDHSSPESPE